MRVRVEIKASTSPQVSKNFWNSIDALAPDQTVVIAPVDHPYPISEQVKVMPLKAFLAEFN